MNKLLRKRKKKVETEGMKEMKKKAIFLLFFFLKLLSDLRNFYRPLRLFVFFFFRKVLFSVYGR